MLPFYGWRELVSSTGDGILPFCASVDSQLCWWGCGVFGGLSCPLFPISFQSYIFLLPLHILPIPLSTLTGSWNPYLYWFPAVESLVCVKAWEEDNCHLAWTDQQHWQWDWGFSEDGGQSVVCQSGWSHILYDGSRVVACHRREAGDLNIKFLEEPREEYCLNSNENHIFCWPTSDVSKVATILSKMVVFISKVTSNYLQRMGIFSNLRELFKSLIVTVGPWLYNECI